MKDTRKHFRMDKTTHSYLKKISELTGKPMSKIIGSIIEELAFICCAYKDGAKISISSSVNESCVLLSVSGTRTIVFGQFDAQNEKEELQKLREGLESENGKVS